MKITKKLIAWFVANGHWGSVPDEITPAIEYNLKNVVARLMADGTMPADTYIEATGAKSMNTLSPEKVFSRGGHSVRVKDPSEGYSEKRVTGRHVKSGEEVFNPFTGRAAEYPSESDNAKVGVLLKHLAQRSGLFPGVALPDHEKALLAEMSHLDDWAGMIGGEHHASITGVKALIDDATSGGIEITPFAFDENIITFPLLTGELLPYIDLQPLDKGRRIMAGSLGNPTISWGQGDDTQVDLLQPPLRATAHYAACAL